MSNPTRAHTHDPDSNGACRSCGHGEHAPQHQYPDPSVRLAAARYELAALDAELANINLTVSPVVMAVWLRSRLAQVDARLAGRDPGVVGSAALLARPAA